MDDIKKVIIGIPHTGVFYSDVVMSLLNLTNMKHKYAFNIQLLKSSILYISREYLVMAALESGADYMVFIDSDQLVTAEGLEKLLSHLDDGEDIVTTLIFRKDPPFQPCIFSEQHLLPNNQVSLTFYDVESEDLTKPFYVESCGFGCTALKTEIFTKVPQPWFLPAPYTGEDITFMYRVRQLGYKVLCDPTIEIGHVGFKNFTREDYFNILKEEYKILNGSITPEVYK